MGVTLNTRYLQDFIGEHEIAAIAPQVSAAHHLLEEKSGPGSEFTGWATLPHDYDRDEFARIKAAAKCIQDDCDVLIVIGIGGSYLGARAAIELLCSPYYNSLKKNTPDIYFAGCNLNSDYLLSLLELCRGRRVCVNIISKSGTTTEPALAFRVFREMLEEQYGRDGAKTRIYATTDKARGTLKELSDREGYECFVIPDDVGGRYSVLTPVGLLPMAVAGIDIDAVMQGAADAADRLRVNDVWQNDCYRYAALRNLFYRKGRQVELLVSHDPAFAMMNEWYKQLFGESEGKDVKGLFPASVVFSADLHSMGQYIQEGARVLFETVVDFKEPRNNYYIKDDPENLDGLNFLSSQQMSVVSEKALLGTVLAHTRGGTPNILLEIPQNNAYEFGYLVYFFERACAISGYLLGVNPFDQPGVESYKRNMFALLGKPGYESQKAELEALLG